MTAAVDITLPVPPTAIPQLAREAEEAGLGGVWVHEASSDGFVTAAAAVMATGRLRVGTDVAVAFARSPTITAMAGLDLAELSGGRFVLGLGSQVRRIVRDRFSAAYDHPAARMAEYLQAVRAVFAAAGGDGDGFEGEYYRITLPGAYPRPQPLPQAPPLHLAAVGPLMTRVAMTHADGILGHPLTSLPYLRERLVPRTADRGGRDVEVITGVIVSVADDPRVAFERARLQVAFYGTTPPYREIFEATGDHELPDRLRAAWHGDRSRLAEAVPAEAVERYAIACTPDELGERLAPYRQLVDRVILSVPSVGQPPDAVVDATRTVIAAAATLTDP